MAAAHEWEAKRDRPGVLICRICGAIKRRSGTNAPCVEPQYSGEVSSE